MSQEFPRFKIIDGKEYSLKEGNVFSGRGNAIDQSWWERRQGREAKTIKHTSKKLWAVYTRAGKWD